MAVCSVCRLAFFRRSSHAIGSAQAAQSAAQGAQQLQSVAQALVQQHRQMTEHAVGTIGSQARQSIEQGTAESLELLRKELSLASESAGQSAKLIAD